MQKKNSTLIFICVALALLTAIAYWQVKDYDFINFDDNVYVFENDHVQSGLSWNGVRWAFSVESMQNTGNWHPLTWLSLMLDYQIFALNPHGYHLVNLLFHVINATLLFLILNGMTRTLWQSAFVACLFAIHPLHVESVAWVAERKDVLSTFFWMLTMGAYVYYVECPGYKRYLFVLLFFVLGLMCKPMLVTLPFVLLLLDYWPLQRFQEITSSKYIPKEITGPASSYDTLKSTVKKGSPIDYKFKWLLMRPLLWEKAPLLVPTALSSIVTYMAHRKGGVIISIDKLPIYDRIANAFVSYIIYIEKMLWPANLAVYYPHPGLWPLWQILGAVLILITVTLAVTWRAKRLPYLAVGWLWYAGTLVPVIGIMQVGMQAMADRYTYIPLIGLFIIVAWGIPEVLKKWHHQKQVLFALSTLSLLCLLIVTRTQVGYWENSITLFDRTLIATEHNLIAYTRRGAVHVGLNYKQMIEEAYYNRGIAHGVLGNYKQAISDFDRAIEINPNYAKAYNNRGNAYAGLGNYKQAISDYDRAIEINPNYEYAYNNRGIAYACLGNYKQAISDYNKAIEINPNYAKAYNNRSVAYVSLGNQKQAIEDIKTAARLGLKEAQDLLTSKKIDW
jgi:tetratricopeptide (TPR) repeat protein